MRIDRLRIDVLLTLLLAALVLVPVNAQSQARITTSFDPGWRFLRSDAPGAERPGYDDSAWRGLDVPHDWSIEGPFDEKNATGRDGAYLPAGVGWYRRHFNIPAGHSGRRVFVEFDGVMANSDVWINGKHLGRRPYGYIGFRYELTEHLNFGGTNILAVRADNIGQPASRWYAGAGIYRHVRLVTTDPVHIEQWGTFVTTPQVTDTSATVNVRTTVVNQSAIAQEVTLQVQLVDAGGKVVGTAETKPRQLAAGMSADFTQELAVKRPVRWDITNPVLYRAVVRIRSGGRVIDDETVHFGIREFRFEPATGFWLNGRNFKLKGVCLHQDGGAFGVAVPLRVWERRLEVLRQFGVNAIRTAHNPPAPGFLDLADRMGFIVMDETFDVWTVAKRPFDYHLYFNEWSMIDTRDTVRRDRNHPSVVIYSTGNEIHDTPQPDLAKRVLAGLIEVFHREDPTRPVTQALFRPNVSKDYDNGLADMLDVVGQNYREQEILAAYRQNPARRILGTENTHVSEQWLALRDNPPYAGQFIWAGIDYLGESTGWPLISSSYGLLDRTATPRPLAYQRLSWWGTSPTVYAARRVAPTPLAPTDPGYGNDRRPQVLYGDWTPGTLGVHDEDVEVYSNAEQVELLLNGRSLGSKSRPSDDAPRNWKVPFEPGTLRAIGTNRGKAVATHELKTAGKPARVLLSVDRSQLAQTWDDVVHVEATVVDANGVIVPSASDLITFAATGPGRIVAVDSGDNASHEPFQATARRAHQGRSFAMLKADAPRGYIVVTATAEGLAPGKAKVEAVVYTAAQIASRQTKR